MQFHADLIRTAEEFIHTNFGSRAYLALHLRQGDFKAHGRMPAIELVARQLLHALAADANLTSIFLASDADTSDPDMAWLTAQLAAQNVPLVRLTPPAGSSLGDGQLAILDQIVCARAHKFIGTPESTFTFRIQEERPRWPVHLSSDP
ncbi:uncharacterized protein MONBRDRAFT_12575 [Monosiga brevicollis MX1]|uniref:GDP-fucose protein O-fucosyltransferase 2 n=1 Tax=Monosiga brevicollis TaxID=81824 RepID=A9VCP6_MONBE|nr:uncharacterized protein MONBRDRAFT_12575 [Monosiga brevicollis MX1]EDQ84683.1 predicted protein [Monosiga brevicollis MX1]|eukprot:XP_001750469.1 hypothetical protein [Monosiga brevicollis MX1]